MKRIYDSIMDPDTNPLMLLPVAQRFQIMVVLSTMWTAIFTASIGAWYLYGVLWAGHILVLIGVVITASIFKSAPKPQKLTYRDYPRDDGTPRYDDVWGA